MRYTRRDEEQRSINTGFKPGSSSKRGSVLKRFLVLWMLAVCISFVGIQSTPIQASRGCELVCGEPFIDPNDGQCYQMCCPESRECGRRCELRLCKSGS